MITSTVNRDEATGCMYLAQFQCRLLKIGVLKAIWQALQKLKIHLYFAPTIPFEPISQYKKKTALVNKDRNSK